MKMVKPANFLLIVLLLMSICSSSTLGYDDTGTHPALTKKAISVSNLDAYLKQILKPQFISGITTTINGTAVRDLLVQGSTREDLEPCRRSNHFHNPINPNWQYAGLDELPSWMCDSWHPLNIGQAYSALTWATGYITQPPLNPTPLTPDGLKAGFSSNPQKQSQNWDKARDYYYKALTLTYTADRDSNLALIFQTVGQVLHLLQDMGVPAHVRNDFLNSHVYTGGSNPYELYVKVNQNLVSGLTSTSIISPNFSSIRVTDFWDTNQTPQVVTDAALQDKAGLAEYTNANFVSEGTLISNSSNGFPYPALSSVQTTTVDIPDPFVNGWTVPRTYYKKIADWDTGYLLAGTSFFDYYQASPLGASVPPIPPLDKYVHDDYAKRLLPRAVGYSAGLLNYFFRGTLEITAPDQFVYAIADGSGAHQFTTLKAKVRNTTPNESIGAGILQAVARYKIRPDYQSDLSTDPPASSSSIPFSYSVSAPVTVTSLASVVPAEFTFNFSGSPIPAGITDLYLQLVFKGTLGNEIDTAIAVGMKDINEPMHIVVWNATDRFYLDHVLRTADEIRNNPTLSARAAGHYIDAYDVTTYLAFTLGTSFPSTFHVQYTPLPPGRYGRAIILIDTPTFYLHVYRESATPPDSLYNYWQVSGVVNQETDGVFTNTQVYPFRTIIGHEWTAFARYYPDPIGIETAPWPVPADANPYPITTIGQ